MTSEPFANSDFSTLLDQISALAVNDRAAAAPLLRRAWQLVRPRADELFALAQVLESLQDDAGLREILARLQRMDLARPRVALAQGRVLRMLGQGDEALPLLLSAAREGARIVDTHIALSTTYLELGQPDKAAAAAQTGLGTHSDNLALHLAWLRAEAAQDPQRVDLVALEALVAAAPRRVALQRFRLTLLRRLGHIAAARAAVVAFAQACPQACDAALELAALDLLEGDARAAQARLAQELSASLPSLERLERLALACAACGDEDGVARVLARIVAQPATVQRHAVEGRVRLAAKDHTGALAAFEAALAQDQGRSDLWGAMLDTMTQLGRGGAAFERFCAAPARLRALPEPAIKAANAAWADGQVEAALDLLRQPRRLHQPAVRRHLSEALCSVGDRAGARALLEDWHPSDHASAATRLIGLGIVARAAYDFPEVARLMQAALQRDPGRIAAWWHLAHTRVLLCDPEGAMAAWKQMIALNRATGVQTMKHQGTLLWHKAEELQLDPEGTAALAAAWGDGPAALLETASRAIDAGVDLIGPAVSLAIALRRLGRFARSPAGMSPIPKIIHQYWEGPLPEDLAAGLERMRAHNPDSEYRLYDHPTARAYLRRHGSPEVLRAFELARHAAERADIFRLLLLDREGGIYVDADDLCRGDLRDLLADGSRCVLFQEHHGAFANNFIATTPENSVLKWALQSAVTETLSGAATSIWLRTGPGLMTRAVARACASNGGFLPNDWHILAQPDMAERLIVCAPFSYKLDHRHWMKSASF